MKLVTHLLNHKGYDLWAVSPDATVYDAVDLMAQKGCGALLVMSGDHLLGIVSERDYARKVILKKKSSRGTAVKEIMSSPVICVAPETTVEKTMDLMTKKRVRHLPVLDKKKIVGVISIGDVVRGIIDERDFEIQQLTNYISGGG